MMKKTIEWVGTALQMAGAAAVASNEVDPYYGYALMLPGAVIYLLITCRARDWPQASLWAFFCALNCVGLWRWSA